MSRKINDKVLIAFPGCGGNTSFFFGLLDVISKEVDMSKIAFLTRSGSGFPVAGCVHGADMKVLYNIWIKRSRSYFKNEGAITFKGIFEVISAYIIDAYKDSVKKEMLTEHHIEVLDSSTFKRKWVNYGPFSLDGGYLNTSDDEPDNQITNIERYSNHLNASCQIPYALNGKYDNDGMIDGAMHIPFWTRRFPVENWVKYRSCINVRFPQQTVSGFLMGMTCPDMHLEQMEKEFNQGVEYARTTLREELLNRGVVFGSDLVPEKLDGSRFYWSVKEKRFIIGAITKYYKGFWWFNLFKIKWGKLLILLTLFLFMKKRMK